MTRMRCLVLVVFVSSGGLALAQPPAGPAPAERPAAQPQPAADASEQERQRAYSQAVDAQNAADLARAAYEKTHKPGSVPADARDALDEVIAAYRRAIDRPLVSPDVIKVVSYCRERLAGTYQYAGQFDQAIGETEKAAQVAAGTPGEVEATISVALIHLQAKHDKKEALKWLKRAEALLEPNVQDTDERAKLKASIDEVASRCDPDGEKEN